MIIRLLIVLMFLSVSGCSYIPIAFTQGEIQEQAKLDRQNVTQNQRAGQWSNLTV